MEKENEFSDPLKEIEYQNMIESLILASKSILKSQSIYAKLLYNYYSELKKAGFSDEQAFNIVKFHGCISPLNKGTDNI